MCVEKTGVLFLQTPVVKKCVLTKKKREFDERRFLFFHRKNDFFFLNRKLSHSKKKQNVTHPKRNFPFLCSSSSFVRFISTHEKQLIDDTRKKKKDGN